MANQTISSLEGTTIRKIRPMTKAELKREYWDDYSNIPVVIILSNGVKLYPSRDPEGNGPGMMFGQSGNNYFILG